MGRGRREGIRKGGCGGRSKRKEGGDQHNVGKRKVNDEGTDKGDER